MLQWLGMERDKRSAQETEWGMDGVGRTLRGRMDGSSHFYGALAKQMRLLLDNRGKIEDYLRFLTYAGETRFPVFAYES